MNDFIKFPRTHHLFVLSKNISRDDLTLDKTDAKPFYTEYVTVEEKIDGLNNLLILILLRIQFGI